jgi:hypothetical protein
VDLEECTVFGIVNGHSLGDPAGQILFAGTGLLCWIKKAAPLEVGILLRPTGTVHIEAAGQLALVEGSVVGRVTPINISQTTGITEMSPNFKCEGELDPLWASENESATKAATLTTTVNTTGTTGEVMA